jgi:hypothetical protein
VGSVVYISVHTSTVKRGGNVKSEACKLVVVVVVVFLVEE